MFAGFAGLAVAQTPKFPADIDPVSMSRFPIVERAEMKTDADRAAYDYVVGTAPRQVPLRGPGGVSLYSPGSAEPIDRSSARASWTSSMSGPGMRPRRCSSA